MRLLIDEDVDVRLITALRRLGHDVRRVPSGSTNGAVIRLAKREQRILITRDADFTDLARYPAASHAGLIHLAIHPPHLAKLLPPVTKLLTSLAQRNVSGVVLTLDETGSHPLA